MDPLRLEEYAALRATIRQRGTARVWLAWAGIVGWATIVSAATSVGMRPLGAVVTLLVLVATFEGVFALHVGVERIGRYLQVMFEEERPGAALQWEATAMRFGRLFAALGTDALFSWIFSAAVLVNFLPSIFTLRGRPIELLAVGIVHALFLARIYAARRAAATQRERELDRFRTLAREHAAALASQGSPNP